MYYYNNYGKIWNKGRWNHGYYLNAKQQNNFVHSNNTIHTNNNVSSKQNTYANFKYKRS